MNELSPKDLVCVCGARFAFRTDYDNHFLEVHGPRAAPPKEPELIPLGSVVHIGGETWRVGAVGFVGERYYWLTKGRNQVAMMPAGLVEALYDGELRDVR